MENIHRIYEDSVVPFENTDDEYKKIAEEEYDELAELIDRMDDVSYVIGDYMNGAIAGMKEFVEGMWGLYKGGWEIEIWAGLKGAETLGLGFTVPESLDEEVTRIFQTGAAIISDPINMMGAVIQGMFDSADDLAGVVDDVTGVADDLTEPENGSTSMINDAAEGGTEANVRIADEVLDGDLLKNVKSMKDSGISIKPESSPFKVSEVNSTNVINGEGAWLRDVDAEYKILSDIQSKLGNNYSASGKITLYTELEPCPSCQSVIKQFKKMYPNIDIEVIYSILK